MSGVWIAVAAVLGLILFVLLPIMIAAMVARRAVAGARSDPAAVGATMVVDALMHHGRSEAGRRLNGNGVVAVFPTEIRFILAVPRRTVTIRYEQIANLEVTKNLKLPGKRSAGGPPHLIVGWTDSDGSHKTAFQTVEADTLLAALQ